MSVEGMQRRPIGKLAPLDGNGGASKRSAMFAQKPRSPNLELAVGGKEDIEEARAAVAIGAQDAKGKRLGLAHRKNVTNGLISIPVKAEDRVPESMNLEYRENLMDSLEVKPKVTSSYMENLKTGSFYEVDNKAVINLKPERVASKPTSFEHIELELHSLIFDYEDFYRKLFVFVQGLLAGVLVEEKRRKQTEDLLEVRQTYNLYKICFVVYAIIYGIVIYLHEFASVISNKYDQLATLVDSLSAQIIIWRILNIVLTIAAFLGWFLITKNSQSIAYKGQVSNDNDDALTGDDLSYTE